MWVINILRKLDTTKLRNSEDKYVNYWKVLGDFFKMKQWSVVSFLVKIACIFFIFVKRIFVTILFSKELSLYVTHVFGSYNKLWNFIKISAGRTKPTKGEITPQSKSVNLQIQEFLASVLSRNISKVT